MDAMNNARLDRSAFDIVPLEIEGDDRDYWRARSPQERMEALELMRQTIYGYDPATAKLQRILEVIELDELG
jgi:hypothetical protein